MSATTASAKPASSTAVDTLVSKQRSSNGICGGRLMAKLAHPDGEVLCFYGDGSFGMTGFDIEIANRFDALYLAVTGNNSAMNQIRYGQITKYGHQRSHAGDLLGDVPFGKFAEMLGGYGEEARESADITPAWQRGRTR